MMYIPLITSCLMTWSLVSMDHIDQKVDLIGLLPDELIYKIIEQWPAINLYRLLSKRWHRLTSYEHADEIIDKVGSCVIGQWDTKKLLIAYILNDKIEHANILFQLKKLTLNDLGYDFETEPISEKMWQVINKYSANNSRISGISHIDNYAFWGNADIHSYVGNIGEKLKKELLIKIQQARAVAHDKPIEYLKSLMKENFFTAEKNNGRYVGDDNSILHIAAECGNFNTVLELCKEEHGFRIHLNTKNSNQCTPFMLALARGRLHIAKLFHQSGATINVYNTQYGLPLYDACKKGYGEIVEFLLSHDVDVEQGLVTQQSQHLSPLWIAAANNHIEIAEKLINAGAKIDRGPGETSGMPTSTPLIQAAYMGHTHMVQLLLDAGADTSLKFNGKTALETALHRGHSQIVTILQNHVTKTPSNKG